MEKLITKIRSLLAMETDAGLVTVTKEVRKGPNSAIKCFRCGGPHLKRQCHRFNERCWGCDKSGHVNAQCTAGNEGGETSVPEGVSSD